MGPKVPKSFKPPGYFTGLDAGDPYAKTGNSKDNGFGDVQWGPSVAAAVGGQIGRFVAGPAAPIQQYLDVMIGGFLAGVVVNYMAVTSDGDNWAYKNPLHKFPKGKDAVAEKKFERIKASDSWCYVRRGDTTGYWVNAWCMGQYSPTAVMVGYDTVAQFVVASLILAVRHGGLKSNLREILGLLAGITIGSEGYSRWIGTNYKQTMTFNPLSTGTGAYGEISEGQGYDKNTGQTMYYGTGVADATNKGQFDYGANKYWEKPKGGWT